MAFDADIEKNKHTGASSAALAAYETAVDMYACYNGNPIAVLDDAISDSPGFVMGHALKAWIPLIGSDRPSQAMSAAAYHEALKLPMNAQEKGHVTAIGKVIDGEIRQAARILEDVAIEHPTDIVALQVGQILDFLLGDSRMLRDRIGRALPHWSEGMPHYHAILGLHAFGLEEMGQYGRAEAAGMRALSLNPRNSWAQHAVAHVYEMQDRRREGVAFMRADIDSWAHDNFFAVHNWWHLGLFHLGLYEIDKVLEIYDSKIFGNPSTMEFDMVDASAMLWRLNLMGIDVGARWNAVADGWKANREESYYGFNDVHAAMAYVGAGRQSALTDLVRHQAEAILGRGDNVLFVREVASPIVQALIAFGNGDYAQCVDRLRTVRNKAHRFGGSHAQRDIIDLTMIEAARRAGQDKLATALENERTLVYPR